VLNPLVAINHLQINCWAIYSSDSGGLIYKCIYTGLFTLWLPYSGMLAPNKPVGWLPSAGLVA